jgi:hypothetical protein
MIVLMFSEQNQNMSFFFLECQNVSFFQQSTEKILKQGIIELFMGKSKG